MEMPWNDAHDIFTGDESCIIANENDFNRVITILEEDMILDPVCINSCDPCDHPDIDVSPEFLSSDLYVGESETHTVSIANEGVINLDWTSYVSFSDDQNTVESTPEFGTGLIGDNRKINDEIVPNFDTYSSDPIRISANESNLASRNGNNTPIDQILSNFNENYESVNGVIPNIYYFMDGINGSTIGDGGNDMYDGGNLLSTNFGTTINYSDNSITETFHLGEDNQYFTRKVDGLFIFVADIDNIEYFEINGNIGADGAGNVDGAILELELYGKTFLGFVKRVYNAWDPSINHLIIVEEEEGLTHEFENGTSTDYHRLSGLSSSTRLYYLLYAGNQGAYIDNDETLVIMDAFLNSIGLSPSWVSLGSESGTIEPGANSDLEVTIDATSVEGGEYLANLMVISNDPDEQKITIPVSLTATVPYPEISVDPLEFSETVRLGDTNVEPFTITNSGVADLNWNLSILNQSRTGNTYTFTNCGVEGYLGPTQNDVDIEYAGTNLENAVTSNLGIQTWTVPVSGTYRIEGWGAAGVGSPSNNNNLQIVSYGAKMSGLFELTAGEEIQILVGQIGVSGNLDYHGAGGGGSFVTRSPHNTNESILLIAGGGGGNTEYGIVADAHATVETYGTESQTGHPGGSNGNGSPAPSASTSCAGQGAGFFSDGGVTYCGDVNVNEVAMAYINGGQGGEGASERTPWGGFGGGGGSGHGGAGGGGGYSGGGGSWSYGYGGGGGSYNTGTDQENSSGFNDGNGLVVITLEGPAWISASENSGTVVPGESSAIDLTFDATASDEGTYSAQMTLSHNDPDVSTINIPVEMTVVDDNYPVFSSSETAEAVEDVFFVYHAIAEDPEGLEVTYEFLNYPDWLTADADSIYGTPLEGAGDFSFSVTANDGYLTSEITVLVDFESVPDAPNPFNIIYPSPGLEIATLNVVFEWEEAIDPDEGDIVSYTLFYGETISNLQIIELDDALTYVPQEELTDNTTYYWKVVATDLLGLTSESNGGYQSFMVNTENDLPGDFALLSPENASMVTDLTPTMMWEEPLDADDVMTSIGGAFGHRAFNGANTLATNTTDEVVSYDVYLSTDDLFTDVTAITVQTNSYTPDTDLAEDDVLLESSCDG